MKCSPLFKFSSFYSYFATSKTIFRLSLCAPSDSFIHVLKNFRIWSRICRYNRVSKNNLHLSHPPVKDGSWFNFNCIYICIWPTFVYKKTDMSIALLPLQPWQAWLLCWRMRIFSEQCEMAPSPFGVHHKHMASHPPRFFEHSNTVIEWYRVSSALYSIFPANLSNNFFVDLFPPISGIISCCMENTLLLLLWRPWENNLGEENGCNLLNYAPHHGYRWHPPSFLLYTVYTSLYISTALQKEQQKLFN